MISFIFIIFSTVVPEIFCSSALSEAKYDQATKISQEMMNAFLFMYYQCLSRSIPSQHLLIDDLKGFVNYPSKTTVGFAPKITANRKFFGNMIRSIAFKEMMAKDQEEIRKDFIRKLRYCDNAVMDEKIMLDFYDREVDQSKI